MAIKKTKDTLQKLKDKEKRIEILERERLELEQKIVQEKNECELVKKTIYQSVIKRLGIFEKLEKSLQENATEEEALQKVFNDLEEQHQKEEQKEIS